MKKQKTRGFTLAELMMAIAVLSVLGTGVYAFSTGMYRIVFYTGQKNEMGRLTRYSMQMLDKDSRSADMLVLHSELSSSLSSVNSSNIKDVRLKSGQSGNLLILGYANDEEYDSADDVVPYESLVCYFRLSNSETETVSLFRLEIEIPESSYDDESAPTLESFLPTSINSTDLLAAGARIIYKDTEGLSEGSAFYKSNGSVLVSMLARDVDDTMVSTNIHNFSLSRI